MPIMRRPNPIRRTTDVPVQPGEPIDPINPDRGDREAEGDERARERYPSEDDGGGEESIDYKAWWNASDPEGSFMGLVAGKPATSDTLKSLKPYFDAVGIELLTNAEGISHKIRLPNGQVIDVGMNFSSGDPSQMSWYWGTGGGDGGDLGGDDWFAANLPAPDPYTALERPEGLQEPFEAPQFTAPTFEELMSSPGYQASQEAAQRGLERSAAAKGSILSGGFVGRTLPRVMTEHAAQAYSNLYGQRLNAFLGNAGTSLSARQLNEQAYQNDAQNALNQFRERYRSYQDAIGNQFRLAELGANTTAAGAPR